MNQITQETRRESHARVDKNTRYDFIMGAFRHYGQMTARECMRKLGYVDGNCIKPRITELVQAGKLSVVGKCFDSETGRSVAVFGLVS